MLLIKLLRFLRGYVKFEIYGGFVERFLNMCNLNSLKIWDITYNKDSLTACTTIKSYKQMHHYAYRSGNVTKIKEKCGLPFLINRYKYRFGLIVGLILFVVIIFTLTRFIWIVEVDGNKNIKDNIILEYFEDLGLKQGAFVTQENLREMENKAMSDFDNIAWIHINVYSSHAVIELRESVKMINKIDVEQPSNIISSFDGQIVKMSVLEGYPTVKVGDCVVEGDLLISGINESEVSQKVYYKHSNAEISAQTTREISASIDRMEKYKAYTGKVKNRNYIMFFNMKIPLYVGGRVKGNYESKEKENHISLWSTPLPIYFYDVEYKEYIEKERELKDEELIKKCKKKINSELNTIDRIQDVIDVDYKIDIEPYCCRVDGIFTCVEDIVIQEDIIIEQE